MNRFALALLALTAAPHVALAQHAHARPETIATPHVQIQAPLTLADLEQMALGNNPSLREAWANVEAARGRALQAGLPPNPTIGYVASEIGAEGTAGQQGAFVSQEFVRGGKLQLARSAELRGVVRAQQQFEMQRRRVLNDVRAEFYRALVAQRIVELSTQLVHIGQQNFETAEKLLRAQERTRIDVLQARVEFNKARLELENARNRQTAAWRRLAAVAGIGQMPPAPLAGDLEGRLPALVWEDSLARLLGESPELAAARAQLDQARWELASARAAPIPNVELQASVQRDNSSDDTIAGVQLGVPIPLFNKNQGAIQAAAARVRSAQAEIERVELDLQRRLAAAFERYSNARIQIEKYSREILPDSQESLELVRRGYSAGEFGEFDILMLLNAQRTYFETTVAYTNALEDYWLARIEIEGLLLTGSLENVAGE